MSSCQHTILQPSRYKDDVYRAILRNGESFWVHARVLKPHPQLINRVYDNPDEPWPRCVDLKELGPGTGHSILHFIYTGTYECVKALGPLRPDKDKYELAEGLLVYIAASDLKLWPLEKLVATETERLSDRMSLKVIFDIIEELKINIDQVPPFKSYLQKRMADSRFGAPGETMQDVLVDLSSPDTLGKLVLKSMVWQSKERFQQDSNKEAALVEQDDAVTPDHPPLLEIETAALQSIVSEIDLLKSKKWKRGGKLIKKDRVRLESLETTLVQMHSEIGATRTLYDRKDPEGSTEDMTQTPLAPGASRDGEQTTVVFQNRDSEISERILSQEQAELAPRNTVESWLAHDADSEYPCFTARDSCSGDVSFMSVSMTEMTLSSKGSSWHVLESGDTD